MRENRNRTDVNHFPTHMATKTAPKLKTLTEANSLFDACGVSKAAWARTHKVSRATLYQVLAGKKKGLRGEAHRVAVLLGLKLGRIDVQARDMACEQQEAV